ncbi:hypothetical protein QRX50_41085 [Amycolatopsis carbonis]|uniref:Secreted protein n=1 Tax=Amycolatopsis carbonis TaxID=715471 RepID=A0A9Y2IDY8_9PSEU|nr:hypothetical protein [Amycolatopsis sp. 2-15]WIX77734.1 hypothetical protein QRX50_41085 [Amycolatopsis sp. 2-15]
MLGKTVGKTTARRVVAAVLAAGAVTTSGVSPAVPASAAPAGSWRADLSHVDGDDVNVEAAGDALTLKDSAWHRTDLLTAGSQGYLVSAAKQLASPANRVTTNVAADLPKGTDVQIDVRGRAGSDDWTEWTPVGAQAASFGRAVSVVQARISLSSTTDGVRPTVREVDLTGTLAPQADALAATTPLTYTIYATREGLTGHTTANGHVITANDHFVALPSGKATSPKGTGNYTVKVCRTDGSRCEYAPVWDVGPWNTKDDYWNPASVRSEYQDLPQGQPEAYAAYHNHYNGGKDDLGYTVGNPAGIDLADGVFNSGLGLADNGNVKVTYLWTGSAAATGVVSTAGDPMNVRASASTTAAVKGLAANYAKVDIECYVNGSSVTGTFGTSTIWDRIGPDNFISDAYVKTGSDLPVAPLCS